MYEIWHNFFGKKKLGIFYDTRINLITFCSPYFHTETYAYLSNFSIINPHNFYATVHQIQTLKHWKSLLVCNKFRRRKYDRNKRIYYNPHTLVSKGNNWTAKINLLTWIFFRCSVNRKNRHVTLRNVWEIRWIFYRRFQNASTDVAPKWWWHTPTSLRQTDSIDK